jgi:competence protein ComGC
MELETNNENPSQQFPAAKRSKLAIASFVLAVLGFLGGITVLPALICGIIGLVFIIKSNRRLKGKVYAIVGIILPMIYICLLIMLLPALLKVRQMICRDTCKANLVCLNSAMRAYAKDHNDTYPQASNWCEALKPYVSSTKIFICPASETKKGQSDYAININVAGRKASKIPPGVVLLFEAKPGVNPAGGPEIVNIENHMDYGCNFLYADGWVRSEKFIPEQSTPYDIKWKLE